MGQQKIIDNTYTEQQAAGTGAAGRQADAAGQQAGAAIGAGAAGQQAEATAGTGTDPQHDEALPFRPRLKRLAVRTAKDWGTRDVGMCASSIAFFFFMSLIPMAILFLQLLPITGLTQVELLAFIDGLIPESAYGLAETVISEAYKQSATIVSASALMLFWTASQGTMALRLGLNKVYGEKERRSYPVLCLIAIGYTAALLLLFAVMLFVIFAGPASLYLSVHLPDYLVNPITFEVQQKILLYASMVLFFALVYTFIPAGKRKFHRQIPGAIIVTCLWQVFSAFFSIYIRGYNAYTMFYGSLGAIAIFLFWMYCCFFILLIGAYFNRFCGIRWDRLRKMIVERKPYE